jgi:hypothetical protein
MNDTTPSALAYTTPWSRDEWQQAYDLLAAEERLAWQWVVQVTLATGQRPTSMATALVHALAPRPITPTHL